MRAGHFEVDAVAEGEGTRFAVTAEGKAGSYLLPGGEQKHYRELYKKLSTDFGTRAPEAHRERPAAAPASWQPLIAENLGSDILYGYGDPAVLRTGEEYVLVATSNDAPDAFPILRSTDLETWEQQGFIFPEGSAPHWTAAGRGVADFWAPEMARVGEEYWLVYTAREKSGALAIGLARSARPFDPWHDLGRPLLSGGVIDPHLFVEQGQPYLFWKQDLNGVWPGLLASLLRSRPELIDLLFDSEEDRRTAAFGAAVEHWASGRRPMERFFLMQPLIDAVLDSWGKVRLVLDECEDAAAIVEAMRTPIRAQRLASDGDSLLGEPTVVLCNDLD
ncbi:MAG: family 43 glycosylhydrolase, partial [Gemmatimonadota bacterium]|nr:family 43 glycosylhydrolase [Gemmatimonadota bacterium]